MVKKFSWVLAIESILGSEIRGGFLLDRGFFSKSAMSAFLVSNPSHRVLNSLKALGKQTLRGHRGETGSIPRWNKRRVISATSVELRRVEEPGSLPRRVGWCIKLEAGAGPRSPHEVFFSRRPALSISDPKARPWIFQHGPPGTTDIKAYWCFGRDFL